MRPVTPEGPRRQRGWGRPLFLGGGFLLATILFCPQSRAVPPDPADALNAKFIRWAQSNLASYRKYVDYAKHGPKPQVLVPPMVDPPCHACDARSVASP
jgi:hypothetical protein